MDSKIKFMGGAVAGRTEGSIFDEKTGKEIHWTQACVVSMGSKSIPLSAEAVRAVCQFAEKYPEFVEGCQ